LAVPRGRRVRPRPAVRLGPRDRLGRGHPARRGGLAALRDRGRPAGLADRTHLGVRWVPWVRWVRWVQWVLRGRWGLLALDRPAPRGGLVGPRGPARLAG